LAEVDVGVLIALFPTHLLSAAVVVLEAVPNGVAGVAPRDTVEVLLVITQNLMALPSDTAHGRMGFTFKVDVTCAWRRNCLATLPTHRSNKLESISRNTMIFPLKPLAPTFLNLLTSSHRLH